jgi:hypothetical protein
VIGGVAVGAHGHLRSTEDLDLVPDPDPAKLKLLSAALEALDSTMPTVEGRAFDPSKDGATILQGGNVSADTRFGGLDVVQRLPGVPAYTDLEEDAVESDLMGIPVRVCSLGRLREMKQGLGRPQDRVDLENLPEDKGAT